LADLRARGVPVAPVQPASALGRDPQLVATGFWETIDRRYVGSHALGAPPFRFDGVRPVARRPAPTLGEHTAEILAEAARA
jgi:crotonobetainyl-CoA:carnitine CoA-transferase CaiB-like acyl-CoA transferase